MRVVESQRSSLACDLRRWAPMQISRPIPSSGPLEAVAERLRGDSTDGFGGSTIRPGRFFDRPFSRVFELHVQGAGRPLTAFVKILKPRFDTPEELEATARNVTREFATLARVHEALRHTPHLSTPRPIACYPDLLALVTQGLEGQPLTRILSKLRGTPSTRTVHDVAEVMRNVAAWLKTFQTMEASGPPISLDRMRAYLDARLRPLAKLGVCSPSMREDLLRYFDRRAGEVPTRELAAVPVHADFSPENVIIAPECVSVLDFTMAKHGARYLDLAHMLMHVEVLKARPWFRPGAIDHQTTALLSGFDRTLQADRALFDLLLLQNVVCFVLQTAQMNVSGLPARLLAQQVRRRHMKWLAARARSR